MNNSDINRYQRQIPILGENGQSNISNAKVLIIGIGGLGCPAALYLAQAGIGTITIIDPDKIERTNLHRQILFSENDIGQDKAIVAKRELQKKNSSININGIVNKVDSYNAFNLIKTADIILDCTDNYDSRYLINTISRKLSIPLVMASIYQDEAMVCNLNMENCPCLECIFPQRPPLNFIPNCSESGVLGVDVGIVGLLQAKEAINIILNKAQLNSKIMNVNLDTFSIKIRGVKKNPICTKISCGVKSLDINTIIKNINYIFLLDLLSERDDIELIDVRPEQYHNEHNIGGINIPLGNLINQSNSLQKSRTTVVYCQSGQTSLAAAQFLIENGFTNVLNLEGGINKLLL